MGREQAAQFLMDEGYVSSAAEAAAFISSAQQEARLGEMSPYASAGQFAEQRVIPVAVALAGALEMRGHSRSVPRILRDLVEPERAILAEITELKKKLSEREIALDSARSLALAVVTGRESRQKAIADARAAWAEAEQKLAVVVKRLKLAEEKLTRKAKGFSPAESVASAADAVWPLSLAVSEMKGVCAERAHALETAEKDAAAFEKQHGKDLDLVEVV